MATNRNRHEVPRAELRNGTDHERLRHARERELGFPVGRYLQPAPMLFTRDGHNVFLGDIYRGRPAFLICSGPSLTTHDLSLLQQRGVLTLSVNNAATVFRTQLWCSVDDPASFSDAIWRDPGITKFVPLCHMEKCFSVRNERQELVPSADRVGDMPAVFGFRRNEAFKADQWLYEDTFNWGNHSKRVDDYGQQGSRSVMYIALRMLFYLGVRRIYLLGCDFRMEEGRKNYAFEQDRSSSSVRGNNCSYRILNVRLARLKPYFEQAGLEIWNCTPSSGLTAFPYVDYETAVAAVLADMPTKIVTKGMYEHKANQKAQATKGNPPTKAPEIKTVIASSPPPTPAQATPVRSPAVIQPIGIATKAAATDSAAAARNKSAPVSIPDAVPKLSLLTWVDDSSARALQLSWPTWIANRSELTQLPTLIVHGRQFEPRKSAIGFLCRLPNVRFVPCDLTAVSGDPLAAGRILTASGRVDTSWYLQLAPNVLATAKSPWIRSDWFSPDSLGRSPALINNPIVLSDRPELLERLNAWADGISELNSQPPIRSAVQTAHRASPDPWSVNWCYFGNTAWLRETAKYLASAPTDLMNETGLAYCALRRNEYAVGVDMAKYGWERVSGPIRHLRRRVAKAV